MMAKEKFAIASDHAGVALKRILKDDLAAMGYEVLDLGTEGDESVDYPDFADRLADVVAKGSVDRGVLVCGTGIGITIAANRHRVLRAALCHNAFTARTARAHNDANVLVLGARTTDVEVARDCLKLFTETAFEGGRHERRVAKLA